MKKFSFFLFVIGFAIALFYEQKILAAIAVTASLILFVAQKLKPLNKDIDDLYSKMPSVYSNMEDTHWIGMQSGIVKKTLDKHGMLYLYRIADGYGNQGFCIKVNKKIIDAYEVKYGKFSFSSLDETIDIDDDSIPTITKAVTYFMEAKERYPERLPEIINAVMVKKKVWGNNKNEEPEQKLGIQLN